MRITKLIPVLGVSALLVSCDREPVAPDLDVDPLFQATHEVLSFDYVDDLTLYVECANDGLGEDVHWTLPYTWEIRRVTSSSGNRIDQYRIIYDPTAQGVGLTSGDVWIFDRNAAQAGHRVLHGDGVSNHRTLNEWYENQDGDRLYTLWTFHLTRDANGNVKAFKRFGLASCVSN